MIIAADRLAAANALHGSVIREVIFAPVKSWAIAVIARVDDLVPVLAARVKAAPHVSGDWGCVNKGWERHFFLLRVFLFFSSLTVSVEQLSDQV